MTEMQTALKIAATMWLNEDKPKIMVALCAREHDRRHVRLHRDMDGLYVRLGKRGQTKCYLHNMPSARVVCADLVVFYEV